jgi:hypothetical protein
MATKKPKLNLYAVLLNKTMMVYAPSERVARLLAKYHAWDIDHDAMLVAGSREISDEEAKGLPKLLRYEFPFVDADFVKAPLFTEEEVDMYAQETVDRITKYRLRKAKKEEK